MLQLLDLPPELLLAICCQLCEHCGYDPGSDLDPDLDPDSEIPHLTALAHLSRTCRTLRGLAQPVLYHCPIARDSLLGPLIRTLVKSPHLASQVVDMKINAVISGKSKRDDFGRDKDFFNQLMKKYPQAPTVSKLWCELRQLPSKSYCRGPSAAQPQHPGLFKFRALSALAALAATQAPNIKRLQITAEGALSLPFNQPRSLPHLTELTLCIARGFLGRDRRIGQIQSLPTALEAAPALGVLRCIGDTRGGCGLPYIKFPSTRLTELEVFGNAMHSQAGVSLIAASEQLESLTYTMHPTYDEAPRVVSQGILSRATTLRNFALKLPVTGCKTWQGSTHACQGFAAMQVLERLYIDGSLMDVPSYGEMAADQDFWTGFLPVSIQKLIIHRPHDRLGEHLRHLAEKRLCYFPKLQSIEMQGIDPLKQAEWDALKVLFVSRGVEFDIRFDS